MQETTYAHTTMHSSHIGSLRSLDLNLLLALDVLSAETNVTRAAKRLGVTQSAMSHTLARLRDAFDDPLLVRGRGGMVLTPRAEALRAPLRASLTALSRALDPATRFDPLTSSREFRIISPDLFDVLLLPELRKTFRTIAPNVRVTILPPPFRGTGELESGDADIAVLPKLSSDVDVGATAAGTLTSRLLVRDGFRCFVGSASPLYARKRLSLNAFAQAPHVLVSPRGEGPGLADRVLAEHQQTRGVAVRVPHFLTALALVEGSDLVLTAPTALTRLIGKRPVRSFALPVPFPKHTLSMVWHPRFGEDPAHQWFRAQLVSHTAEWKSR